MSGVKVTNERPARAIPAVESVDGTVDDENVDWDPDTTTGIPPGVDPGDVLTWDGDSWEPEAPSASGAFELKREGGQSFIDDDSFPNAGATESFDPTDGNEFTRTLDDDLTATILAPVGTGAAVLLFWFTQDGTGGHDVTFAADGGTVTGDISGHTMTAGEGFRVAAHRIPGTTNDWLVDLVGGTAGTITVEEDDASPSVTGVNRIQFDAGDFTVTDNLDGSVLVAAFASGSGLGMPWFIVTDPTYGAVGDGSTDDTAAINAAIAALNTATSGVLYFPSGTYKVTSALTTITAKVLVLGDGHGYAVLSTGLSQINFTSQTATLLSIQGTGSQVENIGLVNKYVGTPTSGAAINTQADFVQYRNVAVSGFYDNIDHQDGGGWRMTGCWIVAPVRYGVRVRDVSSPDGGDQAISDSWFYADQRNSTSAIRLESGGGLKITNCKINMFTSGHKFAYGIDIVPAAAVATTILLVSNVSIENYTSDAVRYSSSAGGTWDMLSFIGMQIGQYGNGTGKAFNIDGADDVAITHCILRSNTGTTTAVSLSNGDRALIGPFINHGYTTQLATSSYTNVDDRTTATSVSFATPSITYGTAAAGAASTTIRSDAVISKPTEADISTSDVTTLNVSTSKHGFAPKAPNDATKYLDGTGAYSTPAAATAVPAHVHVAYETHTSDGSTTTFTLDQHYDPESVQAWNRSTGALLGVTEVLPDQATISAAGSAGSLIDFFYAATVI